MLRLAIYLGIVIAMFSPINALVVWQLRRLHPRGRHLIAIVAILGNLMWLLLPFLRTPGAAMRIARAVLGPPWFAWLLFLILYAALLLLLAMVHLLFRRRVPFTRLGRWPSRVFLLLLGAGSLLAASKSGLPLDTARRCH